MNNFTKTYNLFKRLGVSVEVFKYECGKYIEIAEDGFSVENIGNGEAVRFYFDKNGEFITCQLT